MIVRERRKEITLDQIEQRQKEQISTQLEESLSQIQSKQDSDFKKNHSKLRTSKTGNFNNQASFVIDPEDGTDQAKHYKDCTLMRFKDGSVKVTNESEFIAEFQRKAIDPYWKTLECI